jgi:hypothetical protein
MRKTVTIASRRGVRTIPRAAGVASPKKNISNVRRSILISSHSLTQGLERGDAADLEDLDFIAVEIAEDLESALEQFAAIAADLETGRDNRGCRGDFQGLRA